jgi:hypothetical protein
VLCELYAKLIGLAIFGYLSAPVRLTYQELSTIQAWQVLQRQIAKLGYALCPGSTRSEQELRQVLAGVYQYWEQFARKQRRPNRPTTFRQLQQKIVKPLT